MDIAVVFSGQPRHIEYTLDNIYHNLIEPNNATVFCHYWFGEGEFRSAQPHQDKKLGSYHPDTQIMLGTKLKAYMVQEDKPKDDDFLEMTKDFNSHPTAQQHHLMSLHYSIACANNLVKMAEMHRKKRYDVVVRCRYDLIFEKEVIISEIPTSIVTAAKYQDVRMDNRLGLGDYTMDDLFAYSNSVYMDIYSSVFQHMQAINKEISPPFGENYLGYLVRKKFMLPVTTKDISVKIYGR